MGKPDNAPDDMYRVMTDCWQADPKMRPTFGLLADKLGETLLDGDREVIDHLEVHKGSFRLVAGCCKFTVDCGIARDRKITISLQKRNHPSQVAADLECSVNQP